MRIYKINFHFPPLTYEKLSFCKINSLHYWVEVYFLTSKYPLRLILGVYDYKTGGILEHPNIKIIHIWSFVDFERVLVTLLFFFCQIHFPILLKWRDPMGSKRIYKNPNPWWYVVNFSHFGCVYSDRKVSSTFFLR